MPPFSKYHVPGNEKDGEILPNLLGLKTLEEITKAEVEGFYKAKLILINELTDRTIFDLQYIYRMHKLSLNHLYSFAGRLRTVNISKAGFLFPAARYLPEAMDKFYWKTLARNDYATEDEFIFYLAKVHAEILFIHPFREGNGRTARMLSDLMSIKEGNGLLKFDRINEHNFLDYVIAVQKAADKDYSYMEKIIKMVF